jgi:hypothetical protein
MIELIMILADKFPEKYGKRYAEILAVRDENEKTIEMPEQMRKCSVCSARCVREFGNTHNFETADGDILEHYVVAGYDYSGQGTIFCATCDWKCNQVLLGNTSMWNEVAHEFTKEHIEMYNLLCEGDWFITEVKRLKRNENARLKRLSKKKTVEEERI